ncbi:FAD-dependent oxidoreductase [Clostridium mediterraneense]|uniref:FAD-dependent oxidoreductase n=1 Tax=Clostridium mediterraneense TaxID=1805472 RepID=UPI00082D0FCB|nr:FAD-dependent oxidoreductase [Clostridium mediterraneense]
MKKYDAIIIGFGKGGKTLAANLANRGLEVAVIEKSNKMYGGTCINIGCIPTKSLVNSAKISKYKEFNNFEDKAKEFKKAIETKNNLTEFLRGKNFDNLNTKETITIYNGTASFLSEKEINIKFEDSKNTTITADKIFINTGARTLMPNIPGVNKSKRVYNSTTLMQNDILPKKLIVIGAGYIGLEFSSMFSNFGSNVVVLDKYKDFLIKEDEDVANEVKKIFENKGIEFRFDVSVKEIKDTSNGVIVSYINNKDGKVIDIEGDAILLATGRVPNTEDLNLEAAGIELTERGAIKVDDKLRTNVKNIWAIGDVNGGPQFTYISLDDFRIINDTLFGEGKRSTLDRKVVPYSVFIDPNLSRVGLSEKEALKAGYEIKVAKLPVATIPRARVIKETNGLLKAIVDKNTNKILGATLLCADSAEVINIVSLAMKANQDYTFLRDNIFTHPTMSEALNDLFSLIK